MSGIKKKASQDYVQIKELKLTIRRLSTTCTLVPPATSSPSPATATTKQWLPVATKTPTPSPTTATTNEHVSDLDSSQLTQLMDSDNLFDSDEEAHQSAQGASADDSVALQSTQGTPADETVTEGEALRIVSPE